MHSENQNIYRGKFWHAAFCAANARDTLNFKHSTDNHTQSTQLNRSDQQLMRVALWQLNLLYRYLPIVTRCLWFVSERPHWVINTPAPLLFMYSWPSLTFDWPHEASSWIMRLALTLKSDPRLYPGDGHQIDASSVGWWWCKNGEGCVIRVVEIGHTKVANMEIFRNYIARNDKKLTMEDSWSKVCCRWATSLELTEVKDLISLIDGEFHDKW